MADGLQQLLLTSGFGAVVDGVDLDVGADVSNWLEFDLHPKLLRALQDMGFTTPTPIQREALNPAIAGRLRRHWRR